MKQRFYTSTIITLLSFLFATAVCAKEGKRNIRKAKTSVGHSSKTSFKGNKRTAAPKSSSSVNSQFNTKGTINVNNTQQNLFSNTLDMQTCDAQYTRCMNKICASDTMGKCICYEDNSINNKGNTFIDIDGMQVKQGFDALNFAKKQCTEILDKCVDDKRLISEKYKNFVQRDCLLLNRVEVQKNHGLKADFEELKECMKPACTVMKPDGYENFSFPEYSLCFRDNVAKFWMDARCTKIIAKTAAPQALKQLFLDEMALRRERSCIYMKGTLSNDRKNCKVEIQYGPSKGLIRASKMFDVGAYMTCSASEFGLRKQKSLDEKKNDMHKVLSMTATSLNVAGAGLSMLGKADPIGSAISTGIDLTESVANLGFDIADFAKSNKKDTMDIVGFSTTMANDLLSIGMNAVSFVGGVKEVGNISKTAKEASDTAKTAADTAKAAASGYKTAKTIIDVADYGMTMGKGFAEIGLDAAIQDEHIKEEELGIVSQTKTDANGNRVVNTETVTERGNCFLGGEWFATDDDITMLLWKN